MLNQTLKIFNNIHIYFLESIDLAFTEYTADRDNDRNSSNTLHEMCEGKAVLTIVEAKELENRDIIGKSDPYVLVKYKGRILNDFCVTLFFYTIFTSFPLIPT